MKFVVVGYHGWYGSMGQWVADCLRQIGHEVEQVDRNAQIPIRDAIYFFVDCSEDYSDNIPDIKAPKVFWSLDIHMPGGLSRACNIARKCDLIISSNDENGKGLFDIAGIESHVVPITYRDDYFVKKEKVFDVVMIGHNNSPERQILWDMLKGYNSFCGRVEDLSSYSDVMSSARIVINQPTEPWDIIVNNRFFEGMGCGALLLQKSLKTSLIEDMGFVNGRHFLYWNDIEDIPVQLDTILARFDSYKDIIAAGNHRVKLFEMKEQMRKIEALIKEKFSVN